MSHQPFSDETLAQIRAEIAAAEAGEPHWLSGKSDAQIQALGWAGIQIGRLFRSKPAPAPEETAQRIDLAPGVTLVLDGAFSSSLLVGAGVALLVFVATLVYLFGVALGEW